MTLSRATYATLVCDALRRAIVDRRTARGMNFHSAGNPRNLYLDSHAVRIATEYLDVFTITSACTPATSLHLRPS